MRCVGTEELDQIAAKGLGSQVLAGSCRRACFAAKLTGCGRSRCSGVEAAVEASWAAEAAGEHWRSGSSDCLHVASAIATAIDLVGNP